MFMCVYVHGRVCVCAGGVRMAATVLVSGPALHTLLQLVERTDGAAGERLEAHGEDGKTLQTHSRLSSKYLKTFFFCVV